MMRLLYLIHQNVGYVIINEGYKVNLPSYISILLAYLLSIILACLLTFYIEKPSLLYLKWRYIKLTNN